MVKIFKMYHVHYHKIIPTILWYVYIFEINPKKIKNIQHKHFQRRVIMDSNKIFCAILLRNGLNTPNEYQYLYEYRVTEDEYNQMKQTLQLELSNFRKGWNTTDYFPSIFVLYASEFFRRQETLTIESLFTSLGAPNLNAQWGHWQNLVEKGFAIWKHKLEIGQNGYTLYKETCIAQGGLPLSRPRTRDEFNKVLDQVADFGLTQYSTEEKWYQLVEHVWHNSPYFPGSRKTHTYYLIAARFLRALYKVLHDLRKNIDFNQDIASEIDNLMPNWTDQLPILIPENHKDQIRDNLFAISNRLQQHQEYIDFLQVSSFLKQHGVDITGATNLYLVRSFKFNERTEMSFWQNIIGAQDEPNIPKCIPIIAQVGDKQVRLGTYNKRGDKYRWKTLNTNINFYTGRIELFYEINKQLHALSHNAEEQLQSLTEAPCFFDSQTKEYLGQGSISHRHTDIFVALRNNLFVIPPQNAIQIGQMLRTEDTHSVWCIQQSGRITDQTGDFYSVTLGAEQNLQYSPAIIGNRPKIGNRILPMYTSIHRIQVSPECSFPLQSCEYRYIGQNAWFSFVNNPSPIGRLEIRLVEGGVVLFKIKVQLLPNDFYCTCNLENNTISIRGTDLTNATFSIGNQIVESTFNDNTYTVDCSNMSNILEQFALGCLSLYSHFSNVSLQYPTPVRINRLVDKNGEKVDTDVIHIRHLSSMELQYSNGKPIIRVAETGRNNLRFLEIRGVTAQNNHVCSMQLHDTQKLAMQLWADDPQPSSTLNCCFEIEAMFLTPNVSIQVCRFEGRLSYDREQQVIYPKSFTDLAYERFYQLSTDYENFIVYAWPLTLIDREPQVLQWDVQVQGWVLPPNMFDENTARDFAGTWLITASNSTGWNILRSTVVQLHPETIQEFDKYRYTHLESLIELGIGSTERKKAMFSQFKKLVSQIHQEQITKENVHSHNNREIKHIIKMINRFAGKFPPINVDTLQILAHFPSLVAITYLCCDYEKMGEVAEMFDELPFNWSLVTLQDWKAALYFADRYWDAQQASEELSKRLIGVFYDHIVLKTLSATEMAFFDCMEYTFNHNKELFTQLCFIATDPTNDLNKVRNEWTTESIRDSFLAFRSILSDQKLEILRRVDYWYQRHINHEEFPLHYINMPQEQKMACLPWLLLGVRSLSESQCTYPLYIPVPDDENNALLLQDIFELNFMHNLSEYFAELFFKYTFFGQHPNTNNPRSLLVNR